MKNTAEKNVTAAQEQEAPRVHPLQKSYTLVSNKHVDYNKLTAFEAVTMASVLVLAVTVGATALPFS